MAPLQEKILIASKKLSLIHGINNAAEHGYARPIEEKRIAPKPFSLSIKIHQDESFSYVEVADFGAGLDWSFISDLEDKIDWQKPKGESRANILFLAKASSAKDVNQISGRGIGLSAVYHSIRDIDGNVNIDENSEGGTQLLCRWPRSKQNSRRV